MHFSTEEKHLLVGAFTAGGLQTLFDGYFGYRLASGTNIATTPTDPAYWLYTSYNYWLPNISQAIAWFGVPGLLYYMGKRRPKYRAMGVGGLVYGTAEFIGILAYKLSAIATGQSYRVIVAR